MKKYVNPVEEAYNKGKNTISGEEVVGLRGEIPVKSKVKPIKPIPSSSSEEDLVDKITRKLKELFYGPKTYLKKPKNILPKTKEALQSLKEYKASKK